MTLTVDGFAPCANAPRYIRQLVSHWQHKMAATWDEAAQTAQFPVSPTGQVAMRADRDGIALSVTTDDTAENQTVRGVIERHLDRFAFREAPLAFAWDLPEIKA